MEIGSTKRELVDQTGIGRPNPIWSFSVNTTRNCKFNGYDQMGVGRPNGNWSTKLELVNQMGIGGPNGKWSTKSDLVDYIGIGRPLGNWSIFLLIEQILVTVNRNLSTKKVTVNWSMGSDSCN